MQQDAEDVTIYERVQSKSSHFNAKELFHVSLVIPKFLEKWSMCGPQPLLDVKHSWKSQGESRVSRSDWSPDNQLLGPNYPATREQWL